MSTTIENNADFLSLFAGDERVQRALEYRRREAESAAAATKLEADIVAARESLPKLQGELDALVGARRAAEDEQRAVVAAAMAGVSTAKADLVAAEKEVEPLMQKVRAALKAPQAALEAAEAKLRQTEAERVAALQALDQEHWAARRESTEAMEKAERLLELHPRGPLAEFIKHLHARRAEIYEDDWSKILRNRPVSAPNPLGYHPCCEGHLTHQEQHERGKALATTVEPEAEAKRRKLHLLAPDDPALLEQLAELRKQVDTTWTHPAYKASKLYSTQPVHLFDRTVMVRTDLLTGESETLDEAKAREDAEAKDLRDKARAEVVRLV